MIEFGIVTQKKEGEGYEIRHLDHGVAVFGEIPFSDFDHIAGIAKERGFTMLYAAMAQCIGASVAISSPSEYALWSAEVEASLPNTLDGWFQGCDAGASSVSLLALISIASGHTIGFESFALAMARQKWKKFHKHPTPNDADDFGRCVRLVRRFPELRPYLKAVGETFSRWRPIVDQWDELEAMLAVGDYAKLDEALSIIRTKQVLTAVEGTVHP